MPRKSSSSVRVFYPEHSPEEVVKAIGRRVDELRRWLPVRRLVLFGSYARGRHTVASDVDLLVVYEGPGRQDAYALVKRVLAIPRLEPHVYSEDEYREMMPVVQRMEAGGRVIYEGQER